MSSPSTAHPPTHIHTHIYRRSVANQNKTQSLQTVFSQLDKYFVFPPELRARSRVTLFDSYRKEGDFL